MTAVFRIKITNRQSIIVSTVGSVMVRVVGLEPTRVLRTQAPQACLSTNSSIPAYQIVSLFIIKAFTLFVNTNFPHNSKKEPRGALIYSTRSADSLIWNVSKYVSSSGIHLSLNIFASSAPFRFRMRAICSSGEKWENTVMVPYCPKLG